MFNHLSIRFKKRNVARENPILQRSLFSMTSTSSSEQIEIVCGGASEKGVFVIFIALTTSNNMFASWSCANFIQFPCCRSLIRTGKFNVYAKYIRTYIYLLKIYDDEKVMLKNIQRMNTKKNIQLTEKRNFAIDKKKILFEND